jgi:hypothetical protein
VNSMRPGIRVPLLVVFLLAQRLVVRSPLKSQEPFGDGSRHRLVRINRRNCWMTGNPDVTRLGKGCRHQGIECLREVPGSYDSPSGELGHTLTIDNR